MSQEVFSKTTADFKMAQMSSAINHYLNAVSAGGTGKASSKEDLASLKGRLDAALAKNGVYFKITLEFDAERPLEYKMYDKKTSKELTGTMHYKEQNNPSE